MRPYRFGWNVFAIWYLELAADADGEESAAKLKPRATVAWARDES